VDEPRGDPQSPVLSGVEVPEVLQVLDHMIVPVVGPEDAATCVRPANESVQERFEHELMNEPYLLRKQLRKGRRDKQQEGKRKRKRHQTKGEKVQRRRKLLSDPICRLTSFHAMTLQDC
jgi:hypothetical protein